METLDVLSNNSLDNIDNILEYNPYSSVIELFRISKSGQFGYESIDTTSTLTTKGIIKYQPERSFLKRIGIYTEDDLPIVGFFKNQDVFKVHDVVRQIIKDGTDEILRTFEIIDIKTYGDLRTGKRVFILSPKRDVHD